VTKEAMANVSKASAVMQLPDLVFTGTSQGVTMAVTDLKNTTSNQFEESWEHDGDKAFQFNYKVENLKMIPGDYEVGVSTTALVSCWKNKNKEVQYWIALEQPSN
jgi:2-keto-4-pentenoate hydratase/2-oxohepta-3-ene-1,7-dioic acid hydratase in catechol pathway